MWEERRLEISKLLEDIIVSLGRINNTSSIVAGSDGLLKLSPPSMVAKTTIGL